MTIERFAVLADIHGNRWALEAVLTDIKKRSVDTVLNLGDHLYGPLDPCGTAEILMSSRFHNVMGNGDRVLVSPPPDYDSNPSIILALASLDDSHINWLRTHPFSMSIDDDIFLFHASPERDDEYLLLDLSQEGMSLRSCSDVSAKLPDRKTSLVLCGHDHRTQTLLLENGTTVHNPGSVGLQAYDDDLPFPHIIESGSPHARYSVFARTNEGWAIENIQVPYDWNSAAEEALKNGREDWAVWLQTGRV